MITTPIYEFRGSYRFLSNFFIEPDGTCIEIEYQRAKCADATDALKFTGLTPGRAKRLGRQVKIRPDWETIKIPLMRRLVRTKFNDHPHLADLLIATGTVQLVEGNCWGDYFWGKIGNGLGVGENQLGKILMAERAWQQLATARRLLKTNL